MKTHMLEAAHLVTMRLASLRKDEGVTADQFKRMFEDEVQRAASSPNVEERAILISGLASLAAAYILIQEKNVPDSSSTFQRILLEFNKLETGLSE